MLRELLRAVFSLVRSPLLLAIALVGVAVNLGIMLVFADSLNVLVAELLLNPQVFESGTNAVLFGFLALGNNGLVLATAFLASLIVNVWVAVVFARFAARQQLRKTEVFESVFFAWRKIRSVVTWSLVVFLFGFFLVVLLGLVLMAGGLHEVVLVLLVLAWLATALFSYLVFVLAVPVMGIDDINIKESLQTSVAFLQKHFFGFVFFIVLLTVVLAIINEIGNTAANALTADENAELVVVLFFLLFQSVLANLAVPFYYLYQRRTTKTVQ